MDNLAEVLIQHSDKLAPSEIQSVGQKLKALASRIADASIPSQTPAKLAANVRLAEAKGFVHPFQKMLSDRGLSLSDAARELELKLPQIKSWVRGRHPNKIRLSSAERVCDRYGFLATASNWPNGISVDVKGTKK